MYQGTLCRAGKGTQGHGMQGEHLPAVLALWGSYFRTELEHLHQTLCIDIVFSSQFPIREAVISCRHFVMACLVWNSCPKNSLSV